MSWGSCSPQAPGASYLHKAAIQQAPTVASLAWLLIADPASLLRKCFHRDAILGGKKTRGLKMICPRGFAPPTAPLHHHSRCGRCCLLTGPGGIQWLYRSHQRNPNTLPCLQPHPCSTGVPLPPPSPPTCPASTAMLAAALLKMWSHQWKVKGSAASCPTCGVQRSRQNGCSGQRALGQGRERICTHPRRVALHLHPDGLGDAVLPPAQALSCGQGTPSPLHGRGAPGAGVLQDSESGGVRSRPTTAGRRGVR